MAISPVSYLSEGKQGSFPMIAMNERAPNGYVYHIQVTQKGNNTSSAADALDGEENFMKVHVRVEPPKGEAGGYECTGKLRQILDWAAEMRSSGKEPNLSSEEGLAAVNDPQLFDILRITAEQHIVRDEGMRLGSTMELIKGLANGTQAYADEHGIVLDSSKNAAARKAADATQVAEAAGGMLSAMQQSAAALNKSGQAVRSIVDSVQTDIDDILHGMPEGEEKQALQDSLQKVRDAADKASLGNVEAGFTLQDGDRLVSADLSTTENTQPADASTAAVKE